jgi:hypothetical protein
MEGNGSGLKEVVSRDLPGETEESHNSRSG